VPGKARAAAEKWGLPPERAYEDYRDMLERVEMDAVSVCTYNMAHRAPTVDALAAGKHVLLEKPMAATLEDARAIMRAWEASRDRILMVGFQPDFSTDHQAAKRVVDEGALGHIYYAEAVTHRRWGIPGGTFLSRDTAGAGTLVDTGVYPLHTAIWLMGDPRPVTVSAVTADYLAKGFTGTSRGWGGSWTAADVEVEDFAAAFVRFENGAALAFKSAWASQADSLGRTFLMGTKGGLALDPLELYTNHSVGGLNLTSTPQGLRKIDDWAEKIYAFARAVRDGGPSPIDPRGVFLVNVVMDGILRSAELG
jgi:predicted dehydrogenase